MRCGCLRRQEILLTFYVEWECVLGAVESWSWQESFHFGLVGLFGTTSNCNWILSWHFILCFLCLFGIPWSVIVHCYLRRQMQTRREDSYFQSKINKLLLKTISTFVFECKTDDNKSLVTRKEQLTSLLHEMCIK